MRQTDLAGEVERLDQTYTKVARRARAAVWWAAAAAVLVLAAACGGATPAADATPTNGGDGWVELDIDSILADDFGIAIPAAVEPETMPLAQAQEQLPFEVRLPAWLPDGFALQDNVEVVQLPDESGGFASVIISWERGESVALLLQIVQVAEGQPGLGGGGQAEAATVNGQPATLVTGTRLGPEQLTLAWARDGLTYRLTSEGGALSPDELLRAAESIPITPP